MEAQRGIEDLKILDRILNSLVFNFLVRPKSICGNKHVIGSKMQAALHFSVVQLSTFLSSFEIYQYSLRLDSVSYLCLAGEYRHRP
jgi:hypothetical protein